MKLFIGADHRGFQLKEKIKTWLLGQGHEVIDCGNSVYDQDDDYPDFAFAVAKAIAQDHHTDKPHGAKNNYPQALGILFCGSGGGVSIAANKVRGIRCAQGVAVTDVEHNRDHNDMNVLAIGCDSMSEEMAKELIHVFIKTPFGGAERSRRRLQKISEAERSQK